MARDQQEFQYLNRKNEVLATVRAAGTYGCTWYEIGQRIEAHHGKVSGALSKLHADGLVQRLTEKRGRSRVYVAPEFVIGRATEPYSPMVCPHCGERLSNE